MDKRFLIIGFFVLVLIILIILEQVYRKTVFYPSRQIKGKPTNVFYQDDNIKGVQLRWFSQLGNEESPIIVFFHGNAGNLSHRDYMVRLCQTFQCRLLLFDYYGYGQSIGTPTSTGIKNSSQYAIEWLLGQGVDENLLVFWGESLGGAAALQTALKFKIKSLILMSTFSGLDELCSDRWWVRKCLGVAVDILPNRQKIPKVECPVILIHSLDDELIPFHHAQRLYDLVSHQHKVLIPIRGDHSQPYIEPRLLLIIFKMVCGECRIIPENLVKLQEDLGQLIQTARADIMEEYNQTVCRVSKD